NHYPYQLYMKPIMLDKFMQRTLLLSHQNNKSKKTSAKHFSCCLSLFFMMILVISPMHSAALDYLALVENPTPVLTLFPLILNQKFQSHFLYINYQSM